MPSLALLAHLIDGVDGGMLGPVSRAAAARAVAWGEYLQGHARRLYASVTDMARVAAALLAAKLTHGRLPSPFTAREVYRNESGRASRRPPRRVLRHTELRRLGRRLGHDQAERRADRRRRRGRGRGEPDR